MTSGQAGSCSITPGVHFFRLDIDVGPKPYCGQATSITVGPEFGGGGGGVESGSTTMPGCGAQTPPPPKELDKKTKDAALDKAIQAIGESMVACQPSYAVGVTRGGIFEKAVGSELYDALGRPFAGLCDESIARARKHLDDLADPPTGDYTTVDRFLFPSFVQAADCTRFKDAKEQAACRSTDEAFRRWREAGNLVTAIAAYMRTSYDRLGAAVAAKSDDGRRLQGAALQAGGARMGEALAGRRATGKTLAAALTRDGIAVQLSRAKFSKLRKAWAAGRVPQGAKAPVKGLGAKDEKALARQLEPKTLTNASYFAPPSGAAPYASFGAAITLDGLRRLLDARRGQMGGDGVQLDEELQN